MYEVITAEATYTFLSLFWGGGGGFGSNLSRGEFKVIFLVTLFLLCKCGRLQATTLRAYLLWSEFLNAGFGRLELK